MSHWEKCCAKCEIPVTIHKSHKWFSREWWKECFDKKKLFHFSLRNDDANQHDLKKRFQGSLERILNSLSCKSEQPCRNCLVD